MCNGLIFIQMLFFSHIYVSYTDISVSYSLYYIVIFTEYQYDTYYNLSIKM